MENPVLLTVRGNLAPKNLDAARVLHNETAGSRPGIEAARALSDLSHTVYSPAEGVGKLSGAKPGELLFIDYWADPAGLQQFFSNPHVQEQGGKLFTSRDASVWMRAQGGFEFHMPSTSAGTQRWVALFRAGVRSPNVAVERFAKLVPENLRAARRRGQLSHELFVKMGPPSEPAEILGLDTWTSLEGMIEHYSDAASMSGLGDAFTSAPVTSAWSQTTGFSEW